MMLIPTIQISWTLDMQFVKTITFNDAANMYLFLWGKEQFLSNYVPFHNLAYYKYHVKFHIKNKKEKERERKK